MADNTTAASGPTISPPLLLSLSRPPPSSDRPLFGLRAGFSRC